MRDVLSSDEQARILLATGIAGPATRTSHGMMFDETHVDALRLWPNVDKSALTRACPRGLFVSRLPRATDLDLTRPWGDVAGRVQETVTAQRPMTTLTSALIGARIQVWGPVPFVATLLGYVVLAANIVQFDESGFRLGPPGPWSEVVERHRFPTSPGGRPGYLWEPPPNAWPAP